MKATFVALLAASLVSAQNFDGIPECAQECLSEAIPDAGCDLDDTACQCLESTQARLRSLAAPCFLRECEPQEIIEAQRAGAAACEDQSSSSSSEEEPTNTVSDQGTSGTVSILPTDELPPVGGPVTPENPSITTLPPTGIVTPPAGNGTTVTQTSTSVEGGETGGGGGSGGDDGDDGGDGDGSTTETDAAPMQTAGLVAALLAAAIAI